MYKEIGGFIELEHLPQREYYPDLIALNSGRNALIYLTLSKHIRKLYIPYYLCDAIADASKKQGVDIQYYHINDNFIPVFDSSFLGDGVFVYIVNYYGQLSNDMLISMKKSYGNIIVDNVQSFFQKPIDGIDTLYSCRKFFGVPDGAYLATDSLLPAELEIDVSCNRMRHILGRFEGRASDFYPDFLENENIIGALPLKKMSILTHALLNAIDYEKVKTKREANFRTLDVALHCRNGLDLHEVEAPFCYPFYCSDGMILKRQLAKQGIYIPTLWPNVVDCNQIMEKKYAENILPLPCDQRYDESDMKEIIRFVNSFERRNKE